jgi:hypothetical protein
MGARLTELEDNCAMDNRTKLEDEIKTAEQHETLKQMLLRLLDDPQIQQKIGAFPAPFRPSEIHGHKRPPALVSLTVGPPTDR